MKLLARPDVFFAIVQLAPAAMWFLVPDSMFEVALQGYSRPGVTAYGAGVAVYFMASFLAGTFAASLGPDRPSATIASNSGFYRLAHYVAIVTAALSTGFVVLFFIFNGVGILEILLARAVNELKLELYSADPVFLILIMARHLVITAAVTWAVLQNNPNPPRTGWILLIVAMTLFVLTSSRLTVMAVVLGWFLVRILNRRGASGFGVGTIAITVTVLGGLLAVFGLAVYLRSAATWEGLTGSNDIVTNALAEFLAYFISPVNYSFAIVESGIKPSATVAAYYTLGVVFSLFNLDVDDVAGIFFDIAPYYNSSLNQLGLLGQAYAAYGPLLGIPMCAFGYGAMRAFRSFIAGRPLGVLIYPVIFVALFDSFRGFLLFQNILAANLLVIWGLYGLYHAMLRAVRGKRTQVLPAP